jgi:hypothetical protein
LAKSINILVQLQAAIANKPNSPVVEFDWGYARGGYGDF